MNFNIFSTRNVALFVFILVVLLLGNVVNVGGVVQKCL